MPALAEVTGPRHSVEPMVEPGLAVLRIEDVIVVEVIEGLREVHHDPVADVENSISVEVCERASSEDDLRRHRDLLKDTVIWNTEKGLRLDGPTVARAEAKRTEIYHRVRQFMERYEFLVLPTNPVPPFPVKQPYITQVNGIPMGNYVEGGALRHTITITGLPVISVPCGFTPEGLPVGLQIVGRPNRDFEVLQLAHAFEQATRFHKQLPPIVVEHG